MGDDSTASDGEFVAPEPAELTALLDGFEVHRLLACGGMGAVYAAEQMSLGREVAIKVLPRELARDETFRASFEAEARAMAKLTHPNLIGIYDFGQIEGMLYLVMEFVDGDSLYAASHEQVVDPQQAVEIVRGIAAGLGHAHESGIVHRDIKPANILIGPDLVPKLGDFGLAVASDDVASGMVMGTPGYVAPEVLKDSDSASPASDVFALGALLHQLLTGLTPDWDAPPDIDLVPNMGALRHLVRKAVSTEPSMRFADGTAMAKALREWLEKSRKGSVQFQSAAPLPSKAFGSASAPPVMTPGEGRPGMLALVGVIVMALIGGGIWFATRPPDGPPPGAASPPPSQNTPPKAAPVEIEDRPARKVDLPPAPPPEPAWDAEAAKARYVAALREAREELIEKRRANREALERSFRFPAKWSGYMALIDDETQSLPERLPMDTALSFDAPMLMGIEQFVFGKQQRINDEHYATIERLHRECVDEFRKAEAGLPDTVTRYWEEWVEWLGQSPLHLLAASLAGEWHQRKGDSRAATLHIDANFGGVVKLGGVEFAADRLVTASPDGAIVIARSPEDPARKWTLHWRDGALVGTDEHGTRCEFAREDSGLAAFRTAGKSGDPPSPDQGPGPGETAATVFTDPELAHLHEMYMAAVFKQIEPLATGYRRALNEGLAIAERRDDARSIEQFSAEILRLDEIPWKSGRVILEGIDWDSEIPLSLQGKKSMFDRSFREKMGKLQATYLEQLKGLHNRHLVKQMDARELEREIARFEQPAGTVRTRYIKLQANEAPADMEIGHVVINELNILDATGDPLPQDSMEIVGASTHQEARGGNAARWPRNVLDGMPNTFWHSRWAPTLAPFPHWIAIDLGKAQFISGFRALPRQDWQRRGDLCRWTLFTSLDGTDWTEAASGNFPKAREEQEFRFPAVRWSGKSRRMALGGVS